LLDGFCTKNEKNEKVGLLECASFLKQQWGLEPNEATIARCLAANGFSSLKMRRRTAGYKFDLEKLIDLYVADIERFWMLGVKELSPTAIACMDSSSLGWRMLTKRTYSLKGSQQPKLREGNPTYTNLVVWAVFPDGVNRCPALLLTGDSQFSGRSRKKERLDRLIQKYQIDPCRIVFCDGKQYVCLRRLFKRF
jgi:hypothetical protein